MSIEDELAGIRKATERQNTLLEQLIALQSTDLVTVQQAGARLNISVRKIWERLAQKKYTSYREGKSVRVSLSEIRRKMAEEGQDAA